MLRPWISQAVTASLALVALGSVAKAAGFVRVSWRWILAPLVVPLGIGALLMVVVVMVTFAGDVP